MQKPRRAKDDLDNQLEWSFDAETLGRTKKVYSVISFGLLFYCNIALRNNSKQCFHFRSKGIAVFRTDEKSILCLAGLLATTACAWVALFR